jgi:adenylate cyclase
VYRPRGVPDYDGDVIPNETNLHGVGIAIATRLQAICPPRAICVSRLVRDQIGNRLGLGFKELGALDLKNMVRPIEAFLLELAATIPLLASNPKSVRRTAEMAGTLFACAATAIIIIIAVRNTAGLHR